MCDVAGIAGFGISAAQSVLGGISSSIQTKNAALQAHTNNLMEYWKSEMVARVQTKQYEFNKELARSAFEDNLAQIGRQEQQIMEAASETTQTIQAQGRKARGTAAAAAGESGVGGISIESVLADMVGKERDAISVAQRQKEWDYEGVKSARKQAGTQMIDRTFSMAPGIQPIMPTYQKPSTGMNWVSSGLQILGAGMDSYSAANARIKAGTSSRIF